MPDKKKIEKLKALGSDPKRQAKLAEHDALVAREAAAAGRLGLESHARKVAAEVRAEIAPGGALVPEQGWLSFAPMPNDLCRLSPFYPMAPKQLADRPLLRGVVIAKSGWGEILYSGPKLSTFEEDILLALLALIRNGKQSGEMNTPWTYAGPLRPILTIMGYKVTGKRNYERVKSAIELLQMAVIRLQTKSGLWDRVNMVSHSGGNEKKDTISVTLNPFFVEMYEAGSINLIDMAKRAELTRPVAKALHRFATSHSGEWRGHFLTLAGVINLETDKPHFEIRRQIKQAMTDLRKVGVLAPRSKFSGDVVTLAVMAQGAKALPK